MHTLTDPQFLIVAAGLVLGLISWITGGDGGFPPCAP